MHMFLTMSVTLSLTARLQHPPLPYKALPNCLLPLSSLPLFAIPTLPLPAPYDNLRPTFPSDSFPISSMEEYTVINSEPRIDDIMC